MTEVLVVPETLNHDGFEALVSEWSAAQKSKLLIDARRVGWVSPYGVLGLLALGTASRKLSGERPWLELPDSREVASYLTRIRFFELAQDIYEMGAKVRKPRQRVSEALLEITPIRSHQDVHAVVDSVRERAALILGKRLGYPPPGVLHFSVILSEVCQNIVEHAGAEGWVAAQAYKWSPKIGREVVVIAVMDVGMGFRGSLAREHAQRYGDRWSDVTALEAAFFSGVSRYRDPGRGQGLKGIRKQVTRWNGIVTIRSGPAQIAVVPDWDDTEQVISRLPDFPGAQIQIVLPKYSPPTGEPRER